VLMPSQLSLHRLAVMSPQVAPDQIALARGILDSPSQKKSIGMSEWSAPLKAFHRIGPLFMTVEMIDKPSRLLFGRITGVWHCPEEPGV
jgi:hypothetical protein